MSLLRLAARGTLFSLIPAFLAAQSGATGVVTGRISTRADTGTVSPTPGATVAIDGAALGAISGPDGRFRIDRVPAGAYTVRIRLLGFRAAERAIRVRSGDTVRVDVTLQSEAQLLSPVRTDAPSEDAELFVARPNVGTIRMAKDAIAGVPSVGEPDVVRVAQLLPGVVARNDFSTGLVVRGGEADQNLVLLDGHPIYNPFHLGGLFSTFMDATVGGIELATAAFSSRYGGRLSSVLDVRSAEDARSGVHATADVSALAATGRLAGSFAQGRGLWSMAARRTYADAVAQIFTDNVFPYHFRDFHGRAVYSFPGSVRVSITAYVGKDILDADFTKLEADSAPSRASEGTWSVDWGNRVLGAAISKEFAPGARLPLLGLRLSEGGTIEQRFSTSSFDALLAVGDGAFDERNEVRDFRAAGSLTARTAVHDVSVGYDAATHRFRYASGSTTTATSAFDVVQRPVSGAVWVDDLWRVSPRLLVQTGLRGEALSTRDWLALSPRVSVKLFATPDLAISGAVGRVTQWMHSLAGDGPLRYFDIWLASDEHTPVATAWHYVAGAERRLAAGMVRVEGYVKRYDRVMEANWSEDPGRRGDEFFSATGTSYGADLLARWQPPTGIGGWVAYSYGVGSSRVDLQACKLEYSIVSPK